MNHPTGCVLALLLALGAGNAFAHEGAHTSSASELSLRIAPTGNPREDAHIIRWQQRLRAEGPTALPLEQLGWAFVAKARAAQDDRYYARALRAADMLAHEFGETPEALLLRGHALHNTHRFAEAEAVARRLVALRGIAIDHGLLSDALMEQGKIQEAAEACQQFVNLRPGLESYARAAHLRWLTGDVEGAAGLMRAAVRAGSPRDGEPYAWALSRISGYELQLGDLPRALALAELALQAVSDFTPAQFARGRALLALGRNTEAVAALESVATKTTLPEHQWWLAEALRAGGETERAAEIDAAITAPGETDDPRTLALLLATRAVDTAKALALARAELAVRQDPLTHDALAWALLATGDVAEARRAIALALAHGTCDARLSLHAGLIARAAGEAEEASRHLQHARAHAATLLPCERALLGPRV